MARPVGDWQSQQDELRQQRDLIHNGADMLAYQAGKVRGSRGDYETPPWMEHLHELSSMSELQRTQFAQAHRYGQTEGYVEHAPDLIADEFVPRAEHIAAQADRARTMVGNADTALRAKGIIAFAGRRGSSAPTMRRARVAHEKFGAAQAAGDALQQELHARLADVEIKRASLAESPWKPHD